MLYLGRATPESIPKHMEPALAGPLSLCPSSSIQRAVQNKKKKVVKAALREPAPLQQKEKKIKY